MKPPFRSLLSRIAVLHILVLVAAAIAMPIAMYALLSSTATSFEREVLRAHADTIAGFLVKGDDGNLTLRLPQDLRAFYAHRIEGFEYAVVDAKGRVISSSRAGRALLSRDSDAGEPTFFSRPTATSSYALAAIPERKAGATVWVQLGQDLGYPDVIFDDIVANFLPQVAWFVLPILLLLLAIDLIVVRRTLQPVVRISELANSIAPTRMDVRLPTADLPREVLPLVAAVNSGLDRLEEGFRRQREFTADAAHELRTPLAVLRTRLDMLPEQEGVRALKQDVAVMSHVVGQLLAIGELDATVIDPAETADLNSVCEEVASLVAPIAVKEGKDIAFTAADRAVRVHGNGAMLFQAVRNLVENAIAHAPAGTAVNLVVDPGGAVRVIDEGPGIREEERELIFRRFWRRDRSRTKGAGLGLSIVARIAEAHGGTITVRNASDRGAIFTLALMPVP